MISLLAYRTSTLWPSSTLSQTKKTPALFTTNMSHSLSTSGFWIWDRMCLNNWSFNLPAFQDIWLATELNLHLIPSAWDWAKISRWNIFWRSFQLTIKTNLLTIRKIRRKSLTFFINSNKPSIRVWRKNLKVKESVVLVQRGKLTLLKHVSHGIWNPVKVMAQLTENSIRTSWVKGYKIQKREVWNCLQEWKV